MNAPTSDTAPRFERLSVRDHADVLHGLFERARDNLTPDDLQDLRNCGEPVQRMLRQIETLCNGLGCLVNADGVGPGANRAGNFQSADDVPELLFTVAAVVEYSRALLVLAEAAEGAVTDSQGEAS